MDDNTTQLDTDLLQPNPLQPRGLISPDSLAELAASIREHGILEPLVVAKTPAGFQIIAGERRWRAAKLAGLKQVPVVVRETSPQGMLEMAIVENVQRIDLNPLERAQAYKRLMDEFGLTNSEIARRVSKSAPFISNSIRLLTLPDALKDGLLSGMTTEGHIRALAAIEDPALMIEAYKVCLRENLSVRGAEELARKVKASGVVTTDKVDAAKPRKTVAEINQEGLTVLEKEIENILLKKVKKVSVKITQSRIQARVLILINGKRDITMPLVQELYEAMAKMGDEVKSRSATADSVGLTASE
ncbi:ParB/RepB/Spo0J family partition protein [Candidatus Daviesbacteria bacterium]|nr:ParB/RepB/Spo0J family partition protein [Candidatus Daviesbacteria bacterium]